MSSHWYCEDCGSRIHDDASHPETVCMLARAGVEDPWALLAGDGFANEVFVLGSTFDGHAQVDGVFVSKADAIEAADNDDSPGYGPQSGEWHDDTDPDDESDWTINRGRHSFGQTITKWGLS